MAVFLIGVFYLMVLTWSSGQCSTCEYQVVNKTEWSKDDFPNPQINFTECGMCNKSSICDPNNILTANRTEQLEQMINQIQENGKCICDHCENYTHGFSIAIAIIERMKNPGSNDDKIESSAKTFVKYLRETWRFGLCNDSVVILLSIQDRKIFTNVGNRIEKVLSYQCLENIYISLKPMLTVGKYGEALTQMIGKYNETVTKEECPVSSPVTDDGLARRIFFIVFGVILGSCCIIDMCCYKIREKYREVAIKRNKKLYGDGPKYHNVWTVPYDPTKEARLSRRKSIFERIFAISNRFDSNFNGGGSGGGSGGGCGDGGGGF